MFSPQNRLLAVVGLVALPLAAVGGLWPAATLPAAAGIAALALVAVLDAVFGARWAGREISFEFPATIRLAKGRPGKLAVTVRNERAHAPARRLRLGIGWPDAVTTPTEEIDLALAPAVERTRFDWACVGQHRGCHALGRVYFEESSPFGLWAVRRSAAAACDLRVYPDLRADRRRAASFFLHRGSLGSHSLRQVGRGRDFEKLRDYVPGDSIEDVSWKATARRQRLVSKEFQVERTQEIYVIIDASRLSARAAVPDGPTVLEHYLSSALLLCLAAEGQGDLFGLATFAESVRAFLRAKNGAAHFDACREAIYALEPAEVSPDFEELCTFLRLRLRRRALLVVLTSSLDDPVLAESFLRAVEGVSRQHLVLVNALRPPGAIPLFDDPDAGHGVQTTEHVYARLTGHLRWQRLRESENRLRRLGVGFTLLDDARMTEQIIGQYMNVKRRQVL